MTKQLTELNKHTEGLDTGEGNMTTESHELLTPYCQELEKWLKGNANEFMEQTRRSLGTDCAVKEEPSEIAQ